MDLRRGDGRAVTAVDRIVSRHSFSFGPHYDPSNLGFGVLIAHNEDTIQAPGGYDEHPHRDTEIVTWVLSGALEHRDTAGHDGIVLPGTVQRLSAGRGVRHSERTAAGADGLRMVQMWVRPDGLGETPEYGQADLSAALDGGGLVAAVSGRPGDDPALRIRQAGAAMLIARLAKGQSVELPTAPMAHLFVARGAVGLETDGPALTLAAGDAARLLRAQGERVTARESSEILVWALHA